MHDASHDIRKVAMALDEWAPRYDDLVEVRRGSGEKFGEDQEKGCFWYPGIRICCAPTSPQSASSAPSAS
jgi:hypothetical protein